MTDEVSLTRATYDSVSDAYAARTNALWPAVIPHLDWFTAHVGVGAHVVDIGCGPGRDVRALRERGLRAAGLDLSIGQLMTSGLTGVALADMRTLPLKPGVVDGAWCQAAFLHVPRRDAVTVLREFRRVISEGGALFLCTGEDESEGWEIERYGPEHPRYFVYHRADELVAALSGTGFDVLDVTIEETQRRWVHIRAVAAGSVEPT